MVSLEQYDTIIDEIPSFYQFMSSLDRDDFVTEVIVNDLDAGASKTTIDFTPSQMVVTGNGEPIESDGWKRLAVLQSAGRRVREKSDGIGIKNHGLKTGFLIGDQITISSGRLYSRQVIDKNRNGSMPEPGAMVQPLGSDRLVEGCEIAIPYRQRDFSTGSGSGEGETASARFVDIVEGRVDEYDRSDVQWDLLEYCKRDTEANVRIWDQLQMLSRPGGD